LSGEALALDRITLNSNHFPRANLFSPAKQPRLHLLVNVAVETFALDVAIVENIQISGDS
jgi:hypothetical protein